MKRLARTGGAALAAFIVGVVVTLTVQGHGAPLTRVSDQGGGLAAPTTRPEPPQTFLAWIPNGIPTGFATSAAGVAGVGRVTEVAEDNVWLARSWSADGTAVDRPRRPYAIPIDAAAVRPRSFAAFLPPADRAVTAALAEGEGVLGATSASLRGLGPGAVLRFVDGTDVTIAAVLPDEQVGAAELLVSRATGTSIGVRLDRYLLLQPSDGTRLTSAMLLRRLRPLVPTSGTAPKLQVRAPGETPYFRAGDAVLPPVLIKTLFGEFSALPQPRHPGYLLIDPRWVRAHIITTAVPLLGRVTCNRGIVPQLRGAMRELVRRGWSDLIQTYHGCFAPRFVNRVPTAMISHHAWGIAFDINLAGNTFGAPPHQDPRLVRLLAQWGFEWGGSWIVPDGNHFEYRRPTRTAA